MRLIAVPLDGSPQAEHALPVAVTLARRVGARIEVVVVHEPTLVPHGGHGAPFVDRRLDAEVKTTLHRYADTIRERLADRKHQVTVDAVLLEGPPAEAIAGYATEAKPDVVVMTTHGRGGLSRLWLGSVADGLLRRIRVPVLLVRPARRGPASPAARGFARVLVAVDGERGSEEAISTAVALTGVGKVSYTLLQVVMPFHPIVRSFTSRAEYKQDTLQQRSLAEAYLNTLAGRWRSRGLRVNSATCVDIQPARGITAFAREAQADLIVLATHGRGPLGRFLLGSVADKVLRTASIPVLLCRDPANVASGGAEAPE